VRTVIHLPSPRTIVLQGGAQLLETALVPIGLFYGILTILGFGDGVMAAMAWALAAIGFRLVLRKKIPIMLLGTTALLGARTVLGLTTGSEFLYFLQPTLQNFVLALIFVLSTPFDRPLLARLAAEVCSFPDGLAAHPRILRFFRQVSILWAVVFGIIGTGTLVALLKLAVGDFVPVATVGYYSLIGIAIVFSVLWFRHALRAEQIVLRLGPPQAVRAA
jgi:hypothetical protein